MARCGCPAFSHMAVTCVHAAATDSFFCSSP
ncbi:MAG: SWIM zinc finger family protein [Lachnospiraceae bacterium]|nr:SWIM zinc finger family protein [Lachnospiraceae bacterium]